MRKSYRTRVIRPKRPSTRVVRAGTSSVSASSQVTAYAFTASDPCTIRSINLNTGAVGTTNANIPFVLVKVPEGYSVNAINYPALALDLYNPTNMVLISGVITDTTDTISKYNRIGRKMHTGDRLALVYSNLTPANQEVTFEISFTELK